MSKVILYCLLVTLPPLVVSGLPPQVAAAFEQQIVPGISRYQVIYMSTVYLLIANFLSGQFLAKTLTWVVALAFPMFFVTPSIIYLSRITGLSSATNNYGPHYLDLIISMFIFIPLSIGLIALLRGPAKEYERHMILQYQGISLGRKRLLIGCRILVHLLFSVVPALVEVIREEKVLGRIRRSSKIRIDELRASAWLLLRIVCHAVCETLQYIPLWVSEIAALPTRGQSKGGNKS